MSITVNESGILHELEMVTSNIGGVLYELDPVHANEGGVLYEIHSAASFPNSLKWGYTKDLSGSLPSISNNGFTVKNTSNNLSCATVFSNAFEIKDKVRITYSITFSSSYPSSSSGVAVRMTDGDAFFDNVTSSTTSDTLSKTTILTTGKYYIVGGSAGDGPSGGGANRNCRINKLEDMFKMINSLATLTEKLATSMECKRRRLGVSKYWRSATARSGERSWATYLPPLLE